MILIVVATLAVASDRGKPCHYTVVSKKCVKKQGALSDSLKLAFALI